MPFLPCLLALFTTPVITRVVSTKIEILLPFGLWVFVHVTTLNLVRLPLVGLDHTVSQLVSGVKAQGAPVSLKMKVGAVCQSIRARVMCCFLCVCV